MIHSATTTGTHAFGHQTQAPENWHCWLAVCVPQLCSPTAASHSVVRPAFFHPAYRLLLPLLLMLLPHPSLARLRYCSVLVSILMISPVFMNSGTWMVAPVSRVATLLPPPADAEEQHTDRQGITRQVESAGMDYLERDECNTPSAGFTTANMIKSACWLRVMCACVQGWLFGSVTQYHSALLGTHRWRCCP